MNCANHPETPAVAYCQFCGKPLCAQCAHKINNIVGCEPCLAVRVQSATAGAYGVPGGRGFQSTATGPLPSGIIEPPPSWGTQPWLAFLLGWIPGVGAMYNGQFAKALAHVVIFAILVALKDTSGVFGILVAAWIFYQVFDAYQTAVARRDGLPLPNPLGLNDVAHWFGARPTGTYPSSNPWFNNAGNPNATNENPNAAPPGTAPAPGAGPVGESAPGFEPVSGFAASYTAPPVPPAPPRPPDPLGRHWDNRGVPTGAVVLIVLGIAFLLGNMGILSDHWLGRGWPILLIGFGIWLAIQRSRRLPPGGVR